jgi:kinesin family protein 4/21/27
MNSQTGASPVDAKVSAQLEQQAKHIEEQDAMIKTLNKQLSHCETDLQAHMDLVSTLETSLGDSEKNRTQFCYADLMLLRTFFLHI